MVTRRRISENLEEDKEDLEEFTNTSKWKSENVEDGKKRFRVDYKRKKVR